VKVNREELLKQLQTVTPGLSPKELIEQSSCFVFKDKKVMTFNDEIACTHPVCLKIEGAVTSKSFISILQKLQEEELDIEAKDGELLLVGKKKKAGIRMEKEILLPVESVDATKNWVDLSEDFTEAVKRVQYCAGKDSTEFLITCIHITPDYMEASDNYQVGRYAVKTGIKKPILVRRDSLKHIASLDMTQFCETKSWLHFKNPSDLILSCRKYVEDYPTDEITKYLKAKGTKTQLPKGIRDSVDKAQVFSSENVEDNVVTVHLQRGKIKIKGKGVSGWFSEVKKIHYKGEEMAFSVAPQLLADLSQNYNDCEITKDKLKVESGKFSYVTVLNPIVKKLKKKKGKGE